MKALFLAAIVLGLLFVGAMRRSTEWNVDDWLRFILKLFAAGSLLALASRMARAVDNGLTHGWSAPSRAAWVVGILLCTLYGAVFGMQVLFNFADGDPRYAVSVRGYLTAFTALILLMGLALWLQGAYGVPFPRTGAVLLGAFALWFGVAPPAWFRQDARVVALQGILGVTPTRWLYIGLGAALLAAGLAGRTDWLFH